MNRVSDEEVAAALGTAKKRLDYYEHVPKGWNDPNWALWNRFVRVCVDLQQRRAKDEQRCETCAGCRQYWETDADGVQRSMCADLHDFDDYPIRVRRIDYCTFGWSSKEPANAPES